MKCPYCSFKETKVIDKRDKEDQPVVRRRRECLKCKKRFTTYERVEDLTLVIIKKDNTREQFDRSKVEKGLLKACEKRPVSYDQVRKVTDEIEAELRKKKSTEISSKVVGDLIIKKLKKLDKVAYIRFASVYREFTDIKSFEEEVHKLKR